jgi:hypothetical protein
VCIESVECVAYDVQVVKEVEEEEVEVDARPRTARIDQLYKVAWNTGMNSRRECVSVCV